MGVGRPRPYQNHHTRNPDFFKPESLRRKGREKYLVRLPLSMAGKPENDLVERGRKSLHVRAEENSSGEKLGEKQLWLILKQNLAQEGKTGKHHHQYLTHCTDEQSNGNEYFNEFGFPRCSRCALLYRLKNGAFPYGVRVDNVVLRFV